MLHFASNPKNAKLNALAKSVTSGDTIVLLKQDTGENQINALRNLLTTDVDVFLLADHPADDIHEISYQQFVMLCEQITPIHSWY